jgi:hypothetical protein
MLYFTAVFALLEKRPVLVRSRTGYFSNMQDAAEMSTDLLCMREESGTSISNELSLITQPFVFLCCCVRNGTTFVVVYHALSTGQVLVTV